MTDKEIADLTGFSVDEIAKIRLMVRQDLERETLTKKDRESFRDLGWKIPRNRRI